MKPVIFFQENRTPKPPQKLKEEVYKQVWPKEVKKVLVVPKLGGNYFIPQDISFILYIYKNGKEIIKNIKQFPEQVTFKLAVKDLMQKTKICVFFENIVYNIKTMLKLNY
jgi:hypothetical protein